VDFDATRAAERAGYRAQSLGALRVKAHRVVHQANVQAALRGEMQKRLSKIDITAERVLLEVARLAFSDISNYFNPETGALRRMKDLPADHRAAVASVEVVRRNLTAGDGATEWVHKIKLWDKPKSLEFLLKNLNLLSDERERDERPMVPTFALPPETPGVKVH
jgi:phage terminase small subunit